MPINNALYCGHKHCAVTALCCTVCLTDVLYCAPKHCPACAFFGLKQCAVQALCCNMSIRNVCVAVGFCVL